MKCQLLSIIAAGNIATSIRYTASWIDCFSLNNDIVWNRVFLIIRYVQNTLKDLSTKYYNETYKRIANVHFNDI